jgi:hypothetical protein
MVVDPSKTEKIKTKDLDFWLCNLGIRTIKRGCSLKGLGEIFFLHKIILHHWPSYEQGGEKPYIFFDDCYFGRKLWPESPARPSRHFWQTVRSEYVGLESGRAFYLLAIDSKLRRRRP